MQQSSTSKSEDIDLADYKHILSFLLTILTDISRKRTEPERTFTDIARNNLEYFSIHY